MLDRYQKENLDIKVGTVLYTPMNDDFQTINTLTVTGVIRNPSNGDVGYTATLDTGKPVNFMHNEVGYSFFISQDDAELVQLFMRGTEYHVFRKYEKKSGRKLVGNPLGMVFNNEPPDESGCDCPICKPRSYGKMSSIIDRAMRKGGSSCTAEKNFPTS